MMKAQEKVKTAIGALVSSIAAVNECEQKLGELQAAHEEAVKKLGATIEEEKVAAQTEFKGLTEAVHEAKAHLKKTMHAVYGDNESQVFFKIGGGFVQFKLTKEGELQISDEVPGDVLA